MMAITFCDLHIMRRLYAREYFDWYKFYLDMPFGPHINNFYGAQTSHTMVALWAKKQQPFESFHPQVKPRKKQTLSAMKEAVMRWAGKGDQSDG